MGPFYDVKTFDLPLKFIIWTCDTYFSFFAISWQKISFFWSSNIHTLCIHILHTYFFEFSECQVEVILAQPLIFPSKFKKRYDLPNFSFTYFFFYSTLNINHTFRDIHQKMIILRIFFKNNFLSRTDPLGWNLKYFLYNIFSSVTLIHILFFIYSFFKNQKIKISL